jgi:hypothetical protein
MKKIFQAIVAVVSASILLGCAQTNVVKGPFDSFNSSRKLVEACAERVNASESGRFVHANVVSLNAEDLATNVRLMGSNDLLSEDHAKVFLVFLNLNSECRKIGRQFEGSMQLHTAVNRLYGDLDLAYARMIAREISIGEANRLRKDAGLRFNTTLSDMAAGIQRQQSEAMAADEANRRAVATQYLLNQMQKPVYQLPTPQNTYRPPVQTNCTRIGDSLNCTSR